MNVYTICSSNSCDEALLTPIWLVTTGSYSLMAHWIYLLWTLSVSAAGAAEGNNPDDLNTFRASHMHCTDQIRQRTWNRWNSSRTRDQHEDCGHYCYHERHIQTHSEHFLQRNVMCAVDWIRWNETCQNTSTKHKRSKSTFFLKMFVHSFSIFFILFPF